ncbi:hypothetical protein, partial [Kitasatospora aureofaciens]|uniref:hypothetical protein n=1 Tax=Kitasatospora aureofaciens TaxID=1894 RepID=UPI0005B91026
LETGQSPPAGDYYTIMRRDSGAVAFAVGNNAYADDTAPDQMVRMWSRSGAIIVMDDYHADGWLGRPCLPVPWQPTDGFDDYTGTSMTTAWLSYIRAQNPVLTLRTESFASAGDTVELQLSNLTRGGGYQTVD